MRKFLIQIFLIIVCNVWAQNIYRTQSFSPNIKTLQIKFADDNNALPILNLNSSNLLTVSFDEMSHLAHSYSYRVFHCNADWTLSDINSGEYLAGFTTGNITDNALSVNTTVLYTHYSFCLPNNDMSFKISGNYVVQMYEDNKTDKPIAQACFNVVDQRVNVTGNIRGNTDTELSGRLQQLDFEVGMNGYNVRDASTEIKTVVRQNNRLDNQVFDVKPTFLSTSKLNYINNKALIFEGGNEYHRFDISSVYGGGEGVDVIRFDRTNYNAFLFPNKIQTSRTYSQDQDVNGRFIVHMQRAQDDRVEADYMMVHITLPTKQPFFDGQVYAGGEYNQNLMNETNRMKYDAAAEQYYLNLLVKQGGYNYQFWFVPKGERKASVEKVDGSYWQTGNEYTVYIYHRAWGERYDRLVGVKTIQ